MPHDARLPTIAGLVIGIAFVVLFASIFTSSQLSQSDRLTDLSIEGLKDSYSIGEEIDFAIRATGYGIICGYPDFKIIDLDRNEDIVFSLDERVILVVCDPDAINFNKTWILLELGVTNPITIDRVGHYKIAISFGNVVAEKYFIVNTDAQNAIDKTKDLSEVKEFASHFPDANTTVYFVTTCAVQEERPCETLVRVPSIVEYSHEGADGGKIAFLRVFLEQKWQGSPLSFELSCHVADNDDSAMIYKQIGEGGVSEFLQKEARCL